MPKGVIASYYMKGDTFYRVNNDNSGSVTYYTVGKQFRLIKGIMMMTPDLLEGAIPIKKWVWNRAIKEFRAKWEAYERTMYVTNSMRSERWRKQQLFKHHDRSS